MNKLILLFFGFFLIAFILISGCVQQKSDKEFFIELNNKAKNLPDGKYAYEMTLGAGQGSGAQTTMPFSSYQTSSTLYKLGKNTKTVVLLSIMGTSVNVAYFTKGDKTIVCSEGLAGLGGVEGIKCEEQEETARTALSAEMFKPETGIDLKKIKKFTVKLLGEKEYANRACYNFSLDINAGDLFAFPSSSFGMGNDSAYDEGGGILKKMKLHYETCMDKQYGFASHIVARVMGYSEILGSESKILESEMTLKEFSASVSEDDLRVPIDFQLKNISCAPDNVSFELHAFNDISPGLLKVNVSSRYGTEKKEQLQSTEISSVMAGETKEVSVSGYTDLRSSLDIKVCKDDKCGNDNCYVSSKVANVSCIDSEPEKDPKIKGTVTTLSSTGITYTLSDVCARIDTTTLLEYFCSGNDSAKEAITCADGCADGACK